MNTNKTTRILCLLLSLNLLALGTAHAIDITIEQGIENPIPIAIIPFGWGGSPPPPVALSDIIVRDLERSARFKAMPTQDMPQRPIELQHINFNDWRLLGMENLVIGALTKTASDQYNIEFRLIDIYKNKQVVGFRLSSDTAGLRKTAHEISDIIYEKLLGVRGAFATQIAYIAVNNRNGIKGYALHIADADGRNSRVLLESNRPLMSPSWSPDGSKMAYVSFENQNSEVFIQHLETGQRYKVLADHFASSAPAWSPNGLHLALTLYTDGNAEIYTVDLKSGNLTRLTKNRAIDTEPNWSIDGKKLAFTSDRGGNPQIYQIDISAPNKPKRLTFQGNYNARPRYSADGNSIAMVTSEKGNYRIAILDLRNGFFDILTQARLDESPSFAPNDHMIIYTTNKPGGSLLAAVSADGQIHQRLTLEGSDIREPAWGPFLEK